jgi:hypothetical protein
MALQVSLSSLQTSSCGSWVLTDTTGAYSATNTDGWDVATSIGGNLRVDNSTVLYAELQITTPSGAVVVIDIIDNWAALTGLATAAFAATTDPADLHYTVTAAMISASATSLSDGIYEVTYAVGDGTTYALSTKKSLVSYTFALYCNIECCIEQRLALVPTNYECESCDNKFVENTMTLWTLLQALKLSGCLNNPDKFTNILATLQTACTDAGTTCS